MRPLALFLAAVLLASAGRATPQSPAEPPAPKSKVAPAKVTFRSVVEGQFAKWDKNHDGKLSALEVDAAVRDHAVTGPAAAAAAAIHAHLRKPKSPEFVTRGELLAEFKGAESNRPDVELPTTNFESLFATYNAKIAAVGKRVFDRSDAPALDGMHQGRLGDCFVVSTLGAVVARHPQAVRKLFREHADGAVDVALPGAHKTVPVPRVTEAEVALGSTAGDQGLWLNVFEKAYGEYLMETAAKKPDPKVLPLDVIATGGSAKRLLQALTPTRVDGLRLTHEPAHPPAAEEYRKLEAQTHDLLREVEEGKRAAVCFTMSDSKVPPGVATSHAYAITAYDARRKVVHVWNPWGTGYHHRLKPDQKPGLEHGYEVRDGRFEVPVSDFVRIFSSFVYDSGQPVPKGK